MASIAPVAGAGLFLGMILHSVHAENAIDPKTIKKNPRVSNVAGNCTIFDQRNE